MCYFPEPCSSSAAVCSVQICITINIVANHVLINVILFPEELKLAVLCKMRTRRCAACCGPAACTFSSSTWPLRPAAGGEGCRTFSTPAGATCSTAATATGERHGLCSVCATVLLMRSIAGRAFNVENYETGRYIQGVIYCRRQQLQHDIIRLMAMGEQHPANA